MTVSISLRHDFGAFRLDIGIEAPPGLTVLFGRSGSGKTSVINAVAGLLRPDSGRIVIGDRVLQDSARGLWLPVHRRRLGYVFQESRLFPHLSVRANLLYGQRFARRRAGGPDPGLVVDLLGISHLLDRRPGALSGGERQRVALGRALLARPDVLLADEPFAALDEARKAEILPYFERLRDETDLPILYVSHSAAEVARLATSVVVLQDGKVVRQGSAADVLSDPEVTPLGVRHAGALLETRVLAHHPDGLSELQAGGIRLLLPQVDRAPGEAIRVHIEAQDVMLSLTRPEGISALNILPATVQTLRMGQGPGALVQLDAGGNRLLARITRRSASALDLQPGKAVFAVLKAVAVARENVADGR
ncbi:molybdenum ABC transporter ATP-binding protein [Salipiger sp.]|uniref:molybdenum ABC transporter ATP-binding protein n=1 Tax=Salipiger sp. TaxID=2078585 RepID=UPI003A988502